MSDEYLTSRTDLPDSPTSEITLQVTEKATREIFQTRARVAREPDDLDAPEPLTVVRGPHENIEEQWFIEILDRGGADKEEHEAVDKALLRDCLRTVRTGSNVINTRSEAVKVLLRYVVEQGRYESLSEASRQLLLDRLEEIEPALVDAYVDVKVEEDRDALATELRERSDDDR